MLAGPVLALFALGCGGDEEHGGYDDGQQVNCAVEARATPYTPGMTAAGDNGITVELMSSDPAPPIKGNNDWHLRVLDSGGQPMSSATIDVIPTMPDHGHGTDAPIIMPLDEAGEFMVAEVYLRMPGYWQVAVDVTAGNVTDQMIFHICVEG